MTQPQLKEPDTPTVRRAVAASAIGNATEWFDYGIYAVSVTYITQHFFPGQYGTLLALATFAFSFLVRPLGGLFWGPMGDRIGRKHVLALTILMMAGATFLIGVLPTHETIGVAAPILLIFLRVVQGFSSGGEYGGAATMMAEFAPRKHRGFWGSFLEFGTLAGFALGSLLVLMGELTIGNEAMMAWGWRVPFLIAGPLGVVGLYLRSKLSESPVFEEVGEHSADEGSTSNVFGTLFKHHWKQVLIMAGLVTAVNVVNYTLLTYMPTYYEKNVGLSSQTTLTIMFLAQLGMMLLMPLGGFLSDKFGRKHMWAFSMIGLIVAAVPMYLIMPKGFGFALLGIFVLGVLYIPQLASISATFPAMFPTQVRYAGFAITYNVATAIFGGTAPSANEWLISATGSPLVPAFYMMGACVIGLIATVFMKETAGATIRGTQLPEVGVDAEFDKKHA